MRKLFTFGATALALGLLVSPLTAEAGNRNITVIKLGGNNCIKWESIFNPENCPTLPGLPNLPSLPGLPNLPELPGTPEVPETPETPEKPEQPETPEKPDGSENPDNSEMTYAKRIVELVNKERAKQGLSALTIDTKLESAALVRTKEIQTSFSHTRPNGSSFSTAIKEAGATYRGAGENIAWGQRSPEAVMDAWMNSDGHRANILNKNFTRIGVGYLQNASGTPYWTQLFAY